MNVIPTDIGPIGINIIESPDDNSWYAKVVAPDGSTAHTTKPLATPGEAGRAAVAAVPEVVAEIQAESPTHGIDGDFCGNCHKPWPCTCEEPHQCCGICAGSLAWECTCSEREFARPL